MTGFAEQNYLLNVGSLQNFVDFGKVLIVSFVATTDDNDEVVVFKSVNGDAGGRRVSAEVIVVVFNAI